MNKTMICSMAAMFMAVIVFVAGCGEKAPSVDTSPFQESITEYLANKNMDMKVSKFKNIKVNANQATATCSMKHVSGMGPAVQWDFTFTKAGDTWTVSACKQ
jgi:hypothetical protein